MSATRAYLTVSGDTFVWRGPFETKDTVKAAGFRWNQPGAERAWSTKDATLAARLAQYADAKAAAALATVTAKLAASRAADADVTLPVPEGRELLPFQRAGVAAAQTIVAGGKGVLIADEMGLGKTVQALVLANTVKASSVLVICPASLRLNWLREAERWLVAEHEAFVVTSGKDAIPATAALVIVNDDLAWRDAIADQLEARRWGLMIVDEAHRLKSQDAKRTKAVLGWYDRKAKQNVPGLAACADRLALLTGTPLLNRPAEMWPLIHAADPQTWTNFFGFAKRYCNAVQNNHGWDFSGSSNLGELQQRLRGSIMIRRRKADVLTELPAKRRQVLALPANGCASLVAHELAAFEAHEEKLADLTAQVELAHAAGDAERYAKAVQMLNDATAAAFGELATIRRELGTAKAPKVVEHVLGLLEETDKVVVFAHHRDVVNALVAGFAEAGHGVVSLTGETKMGDRQAAVDAFQTMPQVRVFVGNIQAAGVGLTLTASSTVVFAELDWVPAMIAQAEDRCHRIGQANSVLVQHIVLDGSLDARIAGQIVAKQAIADKALDNEPVLFVAAPKGNAPKAASTARPKAYPAATEAERAAALAGLRYLDGLNADGARILNGVGFNAMDTRIGAELAGRERLTDGQVWLAKRVLAKYRRTQLPAAVTSTLWPA